MSVSPRILKFLSTNERRRETTLSTKGTFRKQKKEERRRLYIHYLGLLDVELLQILIQCHMSCNGLVITTWLL